MKRHTIPWLALWLASFVGAMAQSSDKASLQKSAAEQRRTEQGSFIVKILNPEQTTKEAHSNTNYVQDKGRNGWTLSDKIAAIASIAAALQFFALIATVWVMIRNGRRQLRAYVSVFPEFMFAFGENEFPSARFKIHNTGTTPAHKLRHHANIIIVPEPLVADYRFPELTSPFSAPIVAFPNLPLFGRVRAQNVITGADVVRVRAGSAQIYVYGEVFYEDVFGKTQTTRFCAAVMADSATLVNLTSAYAPDDLKINFQAAPMGNTAT